MIASSLVQTAAYVLPVLSLPTHNYAIHLNNGKTVDAKFDDLVQIGTDPADHVSSGEDPFRFLPHFLGCNANFIIDHEGSFQKGYLGHTQELGCRLPGNYRNYRGNYPITGNLARYLQKHCNISLLPFTRIFC